jgi:BASS family bile acid:Na+ symporter
MGVAARLFEALAWLARQGTRAIALSLLVGLLLPPLAAALKPLFAATIFALMVLTFLRVDPGALRSEFRRPRLVLAALVWIMVASPLLLGLAYAALGFDRLGEGVVLGLILQAAAPPVLSATAVTAILGLDAAASLAVLLTTTAATPLTAPVFVALFAGSTLALDPLALALRLAAFLGSAYALAHGLRWYLGRARVEARRAEIDGMSMVTMIVFGIALMDGVTARALAEPGLVLGLTLLAFVLAFLLYGLTALLFAPAGRERALAMGFSGAHRNMAVMLAAAGSAAPELTWLYFAAAQFPVFLVPLMLSPLVHRLLAARLPEN